MADPSDSSPSAGLAAKGVGNARKAVRRSRPSRAAASVPRCSTRQKELRPGRLRLWVFQRNVGARRFYERQGFSAPHRRRREHGARARRALPLEQELVDPAPDVWLVLLHQNRMRHLERGREQALRDAARPEPASRQDRLLRRASETRAAAGRRPRRTAGTRGRAPRRPHRRPQRHVGLGDAVDGSAVQPTGARGRSRTAAGAATRRKARSIST